MLVRHGRSVDVNAPKDTCQGTTTNPGLYRIDPSMRLSDRVPLDVEYLQGTVKIRLKTKQSTVMGPVNILSWPHGVTHFRVRSCDPRLTSQAHAGTMRF